MRLLATRAAGGSILDLLPFSLFVRKRLLMDELNGRQAATEPDLVQLSRNQAGEAPGPGNRQPFLPQLPTAAGQAVFLTSWLWTHPITLLSSCYQRIQDENKKQILREACVMTLQENALQHISIPGNIILSYPPEKGEHVCCSPWPRDRAAVLITAHTEGECLLQV